MTLPVFEDLPVYLTEDDADKAAHRMSNEHPDVPVFVCQVDEGPGAGTYRVVLEPWIAAWTALN